MSASSTKISLRLHRAHGVVALRKLVAATAISSFGDGLVAVAFPLLALRLTSSALLIAAVAAATRLPWLVVGLPAGALVDRVDRRRLVLVVDLLRAVVVGLVAVVVASHEARLYELYVAAFLLGTGETLVYAASRSVVPRSASGQALVQANGRLGAARTATVQFAGPAVGGALFGLLRSIPFLGDAASYLGSGVLLRGAVSDASRTKASALLDVERPKTSLWADLRSGMAFFIHSSALRALAGAVGTYAFCQAAVLGVLVVYASRVLHLDATDYGILLAIAAVGDVTGSLSAARVHALLKPYATLISAGVIAASGYLVLASTSDRYVALAGLVIEAAASSIGNVASLSARYRIIPGERFGVVNNAYRMFVAGSTPFGALAGGALAAAYGTRHAFLAAGLVQLVALVLLARPLRIIASNNIEVAPVA